MTSALVIGAGPAGLAAAAELQRHGVATTVVERANDVGTSWRHHYDRLHLHTARAFSGLPGLPIPRRAGRYVSRDDVVAYLDAYAAHHRIAPRFGVAVERLDPADGGWCATTSAGPVAAEHVVIATGFSHTPLVPVWPGRNGFTGELLHSSAYRSGAAFRRRRVLVVGIGNSGAEIAVDLREQGAADVAIAVRSAPQVVPRTILGVPAQAVGIALRRAPVSVGDLAARTVQLGLVRDLERYGMPPATGGVFSALRDRGSAPLLDVGLLRELRAGRIAIVPNVTGLDGDAVLLADGSRREVGAVVAATGYRRGLEGLVGHLGVLRPDGRPAVHGAVASPAAPGLWFIGLTTPISGVLREIGRDATRIAAAIAAAFRAV
jgi:putative flavoprotein involved in K+ transport